MAGLQASLQMIPGLSLDRVPPQPDALRRSLCELLPDVLIVELSIIERDSILSLLTEFPQLVIVGVDPNSERILLLSIQQDTTLVAADLVQLLQKHVEAGAKPGSSI